MTTDQAADDVRRSTLLDGDVPPWGAAPATPPPAAATVGLTTPLAAAAPQRATSAEPNRAAIARVEVSNAALAWIKSELRTEAKMADLRAQLDKALALGVQRDVLLGLVVDACRRHGGSPGLLGDDILAALGVAPATSTPSGDEPTS
ncbi:hypothetical protein [Nocardia neocaledoniensis]|uniref:hypothetical protein n=1 Tax=Nocardia neocaledoniensis TaxID=236511 RepID=UPI00245692C1|nr:hypothetical protein [Nocardia neocaledoniensis]